MQTQLVLASSSPFRQDVLQKLGLPFYSCAPNIDETPYPDESVDQIVQRLAVSKAQTLASQYPNSLIIGSDQIGKVNGTLLGKPLTEQRAFEQLKACCGQTVVFHTGLALYHSTTQQLWQCCETFSVKFRHLSDDEIWGYIYREQPLNCAGSFKAEGLGIALFEEMSGRDPNSLIGLPLIALANFLREAGVNPLLP